MSTPQVLMLAIMAFMFVVSDGGLLNGTSTTSTLTSSGFTTTSTTSSTTVLEAVAEGATTKASGFNFLSWLVFFFELGNRVPEMKNKAPTNVNLQPVSVYTDLKVANCFNYCGVFAIQVALYLMLLLSVFDQEPLEFNDQEVLFFVVGGFIGGVIRIHQGAFHSVEWRPFWREYFVHVEKDKKHYPYRRMILSWLVNELFAQATVLLLPAILTASSDRVEFVKDATAVLFIAELDKIENIINEQMIATKGNTNV